MNSDKPFKDIDEQINILRQRKLGFITESSAKDSLRYYGYYEIINGYKHEFVNNTNNDNDGYKSGSNFEHIYALYKLDNEIRNTMRETLEKFEFSFKQSLAYIVSRDISENQNRYTAPSHYNAGSSHYFHRRNGRISITTDRDTLLNKTFQKLLNSSFDPYRYYKDEHGNIPPWILVKGLSFGNTIYWFKLSKKKVREDVIDRMLGLDTISGLDENTLVAFKTSQKIEQAFSDVLNLYLDYRNLSSHGGRIYNHKSERHKIRNYSPFIYQNNNIIRLSRADFRKNKLRSSVGTILRTLNMFKNKDPFFNLEVMLSIQIQNHLKNYPEDFDFLMNEMELRETYVERKIIEDKK
ncbi:Abi family protein [Lactiplantibacillus argentoratensis]|uniref:Abi family protein n=1 Tax=Lactiplantibacillus argentoratensis TaxID=271881 RepID=UPI002550E41D|nr:Abi family protein [Lactiplantibacillus argentoratensis]MDK9681605.1 Abi family protein [Lactiplantibacillus argentoratensis]